MTTRPTTPSARAIAALVLAATVTLTLPPAAVADPLAGPVPGPAVQAPTDGERTTGMWYANAESGDETLAGGTLGVPATLTYEGTTSPDGSTPWTYEVTTSTGVTYHCDYEDPEAEDYDNSGDGKMTLAGTEQPHADAEDCRLFVPPEDSFLANYVFAAFDALNPFCLPDAPQLDCGSNEGSILLGEQEIGLFNTPRRAGNDLPESTYSATGNWSWNTSLRYEGDDNQRDFLKDKGQVLYDQERGDWLFRGERGTLVCVSTPAVNDPAFFYPWASPLSWPLAGTCEGQAYEVGNVTLLRISANFSTSWAPRMVGPDVEVSYLSGCGDFLVVGEGEMFDQEGWYNRTTRPDFRFEDYRLERFWWEPVEVLRQITPNTTLWLDVCEEAIR